MWIKAFVACIFLPENKKRKFCFAALGLEPRALSVLRRHILRMYPQSKNISQNKKNENSIRI
jgi:hypothetical protein